MMCVVCDGLVSGLCVVCCVLCGVSSLLFAVY